MRRRYRLTEAERFRQVREGGRSYTHSLLILCVLPNAQAQSRCGFVASRRVGNAVMRNRARRRIRAVVSQLWALLEPGWDLVWIARPALRSAGFEQLQAACASLLNQAKLLREPTS